MASEAVDSGAAVGDAVSGVERLTLLVILGVKEVMVCDMDVDADIAAAVGPDSKEGSVDVGPAADIEVSDQIMDVMLADSEAQSDDDGAEEGVGAASSAGRVSEGASNISLVSPPSHILSSC